MAAEVARTGDAVRHTVDLQTGVVVGTLGRYRLVVQTTPGVTKIWYRVSVEII